MRKRRVDPQSPVPLYHQIAEALQYDIATGRLPQGTVLPPLREAAPHWGVNLHTVRHAYRILRERGVVSITVGVGAVVLGARPVSPPQLANAAPFIAEVVAEAWRRCRMTPADVARHLMDHENVVHPANPTAHVIECSQTQCEDLARQIQDEWAVRAVPWCLDTEGPLPEGDLIATYFHFNDLRQRSPERLEGIHFVAIRPNPALGRLVSQHLANQKRQVVLVERDEAMARSIAADVSLFLTPLGCTPTPMIVPDAATAIARADSNQVLLFSPRMWGDLTPELRELERAIEVTYVIDEPGLAAIADSLAWNRRATPLRAVGGRRL